MVVESVVCCEESNNGIWLRNFIKWLYFRWHWKFIKVTFWQKLAALYSNNNRGLTKFKHIDIKFPVKERVYNSLLSIKHIDTNSIVADPPTKGLTPKIFHEHTAPLGVVSLDNA